MRLSRSSVAASVPVFGMYVCSLKVYGMLFSQFDGTRDEEGGRKRLGLSCNTLFSISKRNAQGQLGGKRLGL